MNGFCLSYFWGGRKLFFFLGGGGGGGEGGGGILAFPEINPCIHTVPVKIKFP